MENTATRQTLKSQVLGIEYMTDPDTWVKANFYFPVGRRNNTAAGLVKLKKYAKNHGRSVRLVTGGKALLVIEYGQNDKSLTVIFNSDGLKRRIENDMVRWVL